MSEYGLKLSDVELSRYEMMAASALEQERDRWVSAGVVEGAVVADIGCGPGAVSIALAHVDATAIRTRPSDPDIDDLNDRGAGLDVVEFSGRYDIVVAPPGVRTPGRAARDALVASGLATPDDVARWDAAFVGADGMQGRPIVFVPMFWAIGRRPA